MGVTLWVLIVGLTLTFIAALWRGGRPLLVSGLKQAIRLLRLVGLRLILGMVLGGMIQVLIPSSLIAEWIGPASGFRGIIIASYLGILFIGGPYVRLPIVVSLLQAGAGVAPIISLITAAELLSIQGLIIYQIPFLGLKLSLTRWVICLFIPPLVGIAGTPIYNALSGLGP